MASLGKAYVSVEAKTDKLKPGLDKARRTVETETDKMASKLATIGFAAAAVAAAAFATVVVKTFKDSIKAASDLEEVVAKFGTVYKDQIVIAEKNAKILVDSYGLSTRAAKEYLGSMQDLLVPMGMASDAAAKMSGDVVKLAVDLGSFNNLKTEDVMRDIQSALVGNYETMKKYGVVINEAVISQEAITSGLVKTKNEINANIKAQAAYQLIVKGSVFAVGDWARTSEGFANQTKQLDSNIENFRANLGKYLLPTITNVVKEMNKFITSIDPEDIKFLADSIMILVDAFIGLGKAIAAIPSLMKTAANSMQTEVTAIYDDIQIKNKSYSIGPETPGYDIYKPPTPEVPAGTTSPRVEMTAKDLEEIKKLEEEFQLSKIEMSDLEIEIESGRFQKLKDMETEHREWEMDLLVNSQEYKLAASQEYHDAAIEQLKARSAIEADLELKTLELSKTVGKAKVATAIGIGTALLNFAGVNSQAIFAVQKGVEVGMAVMAAFTASNLALATFPGPPYTIPLAAAVLKAGLWNAAAVGAVAIGQFAASSNSGGSVGGGSYVSPTVTTPVTSGVTEYDTKPEEEKRGTLTINIQGDFIGDEGYIDMLVEKINAADDRDVFINKSVYAREIG